MSGTTPRPIYTLDGTLPIATDLDSYLGRAAEEPVIIMRDGRPVAALVFVGDEEDLESFALAHNPRFQRLLEEAYGRVKRGEGMSEEEFWQVVEADTAQGMARASQEPDRRE